MNYIYGTWQVLRGMRALNLNMQEVWLQRGRAWLESVQHEDGGWGERCNTYDDPVFKGQGPSTASQTAWENETTGTGFPKVFYLKYDMYRNAWPLLALATYKQICERKAIKQNGK